MKTSVHSSKKHGDDTDDDTDDDKTDDNTDDDSDDGKKMKTSVHSSKKDKKSSDHSDSDWTLILTPSLTRRPILMSTKFDRIRLGA